MPARLLVQPYRTQPERHGGRFVLAAAVGGLAAGAAGSVGGLGAGVGRGAEPERPLIAWPPAAVHPLAGQAGPDPLEPLEPLPWPEPPPVIGGAEPRSLERGWLLTGPEDAGEAGDAAGGRGPAAVPVPVPVPVPVERPAPRDQPEAAPAAVADPFAPFAPLPARGGRSRGGATRVPALSASVTFLARAEPDPLTPAAIRRELELTSPFPSPSPSAGGGASGRSRDA